MVLWRTESLAAAAAAAVIAWLLTLLAMGVACKEIHTGGYRPRRLVSCCFSFLIEKFNYVDIFNTIVDISTDFYFLWSRYVFLSTDS